MKTSELTGAALDWAVAKCDQEWSDDDALLWVQDDEYRYAPSTDWAQGGPIIEREDISVNREFASGKIEWAAWTPAPIRDDAEAFGYGPTPLIAAMRCYVASKLGDEVEVPKELV
jgi:hypothetical protein